MAVPKKRQSRSRRDKRRANHLKLQPLAVSTCPQCKRAKVAHRVCVHCGFYKGREIFTLEA